MRKNILLLVSLFLCLNVFAQNAAAKQDKLYTLEDQFKKVTFNTDTACIEITDKRTSTTWTQAPTSQIPRVTTCKRSKNSLQLLAALGNNKIKIDITNAAPSEVLLTIAPFGTENIDKLYYPFPFLPQSPENDLVLPISEGVVIPANTKKLNLTKTYHYNQSGITMPFYGLVTDKSTGLLSIVETYDDFLLNIFSHKIDAKDISLPRVVWLSSKRSLRYPRKIRFCLFDKGGYVAMCKRYKQFKIAEDTFKTLDQKAQDLPNVKKLIAAANIYDTTEDDTILDWLIKNDIDKVLYSPFCPSVRDGWTATPQRIEKAKKQGYVVSRYDIYTDIAGPIIEEAWRKQDGDYKIDYVHRLAGYPDECIIAEDGQIQKGWPYPLDNGQKIFSATRCSHCKLKYLKDQLEREKSLGLTSRMLDVETAKPLYECFSEEHPMTRTEDRQLKLQLFEYLHSQGMLAAAEGGADWASHLLEYQEGCLTLVTFPATRGVYVGATQYKMSDEEIRNQLDMTFRAPLRELVYNDSMFLTWRWNLTPNRWQQKEYYNDWDMLHILYDSMPIYVLHADYLKEQGTRFLQSCRKIYSARKQIASAEMLSHQFLTKDRLLQKTVFANGVSVIVNFSNEDALLNDGKTIKAKSYELYNK